MNSDTESVKQPEPRRWLKGTLITVVAALLILDLCVAAQHPQKPEDTDAAYRTTKLWEDVRELVRQNYVNGDKVSYESLTYNALKGMVDSLDPHSAFMEPRALKSMREETNQKFGGLGIEITTKDGLPTVIAPIEDTPAFRAGLLPGDKITKVDGLRTDRLSLNEVVDHLKGTPGTTVKIQIFRLRNKEFKEFTLTREVIKVDSVRDAKIVNEKEKIGYLRITQFGDQTDEELEKALVKLEGLGMRALVMDLRGNPGGLLDTAQNVCSKFIAKGELVVTTKGRRPSQIKELHAVGGQHPNYPLAILINNSSASASEITAGCLQDYKRAILVGEKSFGKGSVQTIVEMDPIEFKDKEGKPAKLVPAVKLTTAEYRTPKDYPIHGHGVVPDIYVPMSDEDVGKLYEQRIQERMREKGALPEEKPIEETLLAPEAKAKPVEDVQLNRAVDALLGVLIFAKNQPEIKEAAAK